MLTNDFLPIMESNSKEGKKEDAQKWLTDSSVRLFRPKKEGHLR